MSFTYLNGYFVQTFRIVGNHGFDGPGQVLLMDHDIISDKEMEMV